MTSYLRKPFFRLPLLLVVLFAISACSNGAGGFPVVASPPDFDILDGEELRSGMHQLAFELQKLDLALLSEADGRPEFRQGVVTSLTNIERIGGLLGATDLSSKHPFLRNDMRKFLADVAKAREEASRSSTRYYMAGRIAASCINCHRAND